MIAQKIVNSSLLKVRRLIAISLTLFSLLTIAYADEIADLQKQIDALNHDFLETL